MIQNPILPGFHPDPCICRKGNDFYIAVSSFEWFPGIPIYHSKDMKHWELYSHALSNADEPDLKKLPSAKGIWAPCLTYCETDDLFYVVYGVMNSMNARYFDVDNFLITAKDLKGPWSEPILSLIHISYHSFTSNKYILSYQIRCFPLVISSYSILSRFLRFRLLYVSSNVLLPPDAVLYGFLLSASDSLLAGLSVVMHQIQSMKYPWGFALVVPAMLCSHRARLRNFPTQTQLFLSPLHLNIEAYFHILHLHCFPDVVFCERRPHTLSVPFPVQMLSFVPQN